MKSLDRFLLEQQMLDCWKITDDLEIALKITESEDIDDIQNALIGIKTLYNQRFDDMFNTFSELIKNRQIL